MKTPGLTRVTRQVGESDFEWELRKLVNDAANLRRRLADFETKVGSTEIFKPIAYQGLEEIEGAGMRKVEACRKVVSHYGDNKTAS
jgi:hypothetical protein